MKMRLRIILKQLKYNEYYISIKVKINIYKKKEV